MSKRRISSRKWLPHRRIVFGLSLMLLVGCAIHPPVYGLRPISPELLYRHHAVVGTPIDSFHPTLRWQSFPGRKDLEGDDGRLPHRIQSVSYDLRVWRVENGRPGKLVCARSALPEPEYRLETGIEPGNDYFWTVRARFELNGQRRVTDWSLSEFPGLSGTEELGALFAAYPQRLAFIPCPNYFRFSTLYGTNDQAESLKDSRPNKRTSP